MITITALLLPFMIFLMWAIVLLCIPDKTEAQKKFTTLIIIAAAYFFIDANYLLPNATEEDYRSLVFFDILSQFITVALPASIVSYVMSYRVNTGKTWLIYLMYSPGIFLGTAAIIIYFLMGVDNAAAFIQAMDEAGEIPEAYDAPVYRLHDAICQKTYNIVLLTEVLITLSVVIAKIARNPIPKGILNKFFEGKEKFSSFTAECILFAAMLAICSLRIGLGRRYLIDNHSLSGLLSFCIAVFGCMCAYIGTFFSDREFDYWDLRHPISLRPGTRQSVSEIPEERKDNGLSAAAGKGKSATPQPVKLAAPTLLEQFTKYMMDKKPYLNPDLSITDVAYALRSNRTYISVLINENFEKNFRDYINDLRIAHAKKIMLDNPDEILEVIAEKSGFGSDSQFAKKFKETEHISPKQWLAKQLSKQ